MAVTLPSSASTSSPCALKGEVRRQRSSRQLAQVELGVKLALQKQAFGPLRGACDAELPKALTCMLIGNAQTMMPSRMKPCRTHSICANARWHQRRQHASGPAGSSLHHGSRRRSLQNSTRRSSLGDSSPCSWRRMETFDGPRMDQGVRIPASPCCGDVVGQPSPCGSLQTI